MAACPLDRHSQDMTERVRDNDEAGLDETAEPEPEEGAAADPDPAEAGSDGATMDARADGMGDAATPGAGDTELIALREEFEGLNDRHLRLVAEFNNFKRRSEQERLGAWARAQADLVARLADVLDDLQRVAELDLENATVEAIMEGIDLVERKFVRSLADAGVETIEPNGVAFDPERMEAMMRVPAESDEQVDQVAQVFQKGYALKGNLIRPARVSVYTQG
jgi:molecular chaperone GrpE